MAQSDDGQPPTHAQRRYLSRSIASLFIAIDDVHTDLAEVGYVQDASRTQLQSELATVIVQLRQWRDADQIDWQSATPFDRGPEALLGQMLDGDVETVQTSERRNAPAEKQPAPAKIGVDALYQSALDIIDIANNLGLTSPVAEASESVEAEI